VLSPHPGCAQVTLLQVNLCGEAAAGRLLLAAQRCQLGGRHLAGSQRNVFMLDMQVPAGFSQCHPWLHGLPGQPLLHARLQAAASCALQPGP
jgi:hypothetical protein